MGGPGFDPASTVLPVGADVELLSDRVVSRLTGICTNVGYTMRARGAQRMFTSGGDLTGIHHLLGLPAPERNNAYHIGGMGARPEESLIRTVAESFERYSLMTAHLDDSFPLVFDSRDNLVAKGERVIEPHKLRLYGEEQLANIKLPIKAFDPASPMGWVRTTSLIDLEPTWVPAQHLVTGYRPRVHEGERWIHPAVSTGTAAHTDSRKAVRSGALELIQLDSVMGHWFGKGVSWQIKPDERTKAMTRFLEKYWREAIGRTSFHWLPNADLPGMTIACVVRSADGSAPCFTIGLGADTRLVDAMYKALLEAIGCDRYINSWTLHASLDGITSPQDIDIDKLYDLDMNVLYYVFPETAHLVLGRFEPDQVVAASDLPPDSELDVRGEVADIVDRFRETGKELYYVDLTSKDSRAHGFVVHRVWSPDTLQLPIPGVSPKAHSRMEAYGGYLNDLPHPYP